MLRSMYLSSYNMEAIERCASSTEDSGLTFTYRLLSGTTTTTNYGLRLMMSSGLPTNIKKNALEIAENMLKERAEMLPLVVPETPMTAGLYAKCEKLENFISNLYGLSMTENFTKEIVRTLQKMALEEILSEADEDEEGQKTRLEEGGQSSSNDNNLAEGSNRAELPSAENQASPGIESPIKKTEEDCRASEQVEKSGAALDRSGSVTHGSMRSEPLRLISKTPPMYSQTTSLPPDLPRVTSSLICMTDKPQVSPLTRPGTSMTPFRPKTPIITAAEFNSCPITSFKSCKSPNTSCRSADLHSPHTGVIPAQENCSQPRINRSSIPVLPESATRVSVCCSFTIDPVITLSESTRAAEKVVPSRTPMDSSPTTSPEMFTTAGPSKTPANSRTSASASYCTPVSHASGGV